MEQDDELKNFKIREKNFSNITITSKPIVGKVVHEWAQLEKSCNGLLENIKSWKSPFIVEVSKQITWMILKTKVNLF